jgi:Tfp pilus assembly protein PilX
MKKIIYAIYLFGAVLASVVGYFLDPITALMIVLVMPMVVITILEMQGIVQFGFYPMEEDNSIMRKATEQDMTAAEAAEKYGQAIVNEMDDQIKEAEMHLTEMKQAREIASAVVRGETK